MTLAMFNHIGSYGYGFLWNCTWRLEWKSRHEYWYRSQCGPFYVLHPKP